MTRWLPHTVTRPWHAAPRVANASRLDAARIFIRVLYPCRAATGTPGPTFSSPPPLSFSPWAPPPTPNERKRVQRGRHHWHCSLPVHNVYIPLQNQIEANNRPNVPLLRPPRPSRRCSVTRSPPVWSRRSRHRAHLVLAPHTPHHAHPDRTRLQLAGAELLRSPPASP